MKYSRWNTSEYSESVVKSMMDAGIPLLTAIVLSARGYESKDAALAFLDQGQEQLKDPWLLPDMEKAVARLKTAMENGERMAVYGDYDVDGITSLSLLMRSFADNGVDCVGYIPDREGEGYGMNRDAVDKLKSQGVSLIVTVDCGITAVEEVEYAKSLGVDVIITDHHECREEIPHAVAVVNPRRTDCDYPFKAFAGIGVAYKLLCALFNEYMSWELLNKYSPLVAIGTVADVMPLVLENRVVVRMGLEQAKNTEILGLRKLMDACGLRNKELTSAHVSYMLAPKLNAAGRMGRVEVATRLLTTEDENEADTLVAELLTLNKERQKMENDILKEAAVVLKSRGLRKGRAVVLAGEDWHQGVIGIVASRVAEKYRAPAFMISMTGDTGKASCRSYGGFNLFKALEKTGDLLESYGGHALAAGFTIRRENIPAFEEKMLELYERFSEENDMGTVLDVDVELKDPAILSVYNVLGLGALEPYGTGNPLPVFCVRDMEVDAVTDVGGGKHMKLTLVKNGKSYDAIFFSNSSSKMGIVAGDTVDVAFTPDINEYRGRTTVQMQVKDITQCRSTVYAEQEELEIYDAFTRGEKLTAEEIGRLTPSRNFFIGTWRFLKNHTDGEIQGERGFISRRIAQVAGKHASAMRAMVCLDCFAELGLIEMHEDGTELSIRVFETEGKVDLAEAPSMVKLKELASGTV